MEESSSSDATRPLPDPFQVYNERAAREDRVFVTDCNESIDTMLVFVRPLVRPLLVGLTLYRQVYSPR